MLDWLTVQCMVVGGMGGLAGVLVLADIKKRRAKK